MGGSKLSALMLAATVAAVVGASPAGGQCRLCASPTTSLSAETEAAQIKLEIETRLDFDRVILGGYGAGSAVIHPDGSSSAQGSVTAVSPRAMVGSAVVRGEPGRAVRIELPSRIVLRSYSGGEILFEEVVSDLPALPRLDKAGTLSFRFGGRLRVEGDSDGEFHGDLPITVEYL